MIKPFQNKDLHGGALALMFNSKKHKRKMKLTDVGSSSPDPSMVS